MTVGGGSPERAATLCQSHTPRSCAQALPSLKPNSPHLLQGSIGLFLYPGDVFDRPSLTPTSSTSLHTPALTSALPASPPFPGMSSSSASLSFSPLLSSLLSALSFFLPSPPYSCHLLTDCSRNSPAPPAPAVSMDLGPIQTAQDPPPSAWPWE